MNAGGMNDNDRDIDRPRRNGEGGMVKAVLGNFDLEVEKMFLINVHLNQLR